MASRKVPKKTRTQAESEEKPANVRATFYLTTELMERVRNICYWDRLSIAEFAEAALWREVKRFEKRHGGPYEERKREILTGRQPK